MTDDPAIEAQHLRRTFGEQVVLDGVELTVARGSVFALLGPNGAGKTTTVRILTTLTAPDGGWARVAGFDVVEQRHEVRSRISLTGQHVAVDELLTGEENLRLAARLTGAGRATARLLAADLIERFDLVDAARRRVGTYSGGMRRKLDLAASLVRRPEVIFLDEPTTGLDPRSRQVMWDVIADLVASGITVFLTTQYLEEADRLADRIAVMDSGRIVAVDSAVALKRSVGSERLDLVAGDDRAFGEIEAQLGTRTVRHDRARRTLGVPTSGNALDIRTLLDGIDPHGTLVERFTIHVPTLDDVFMSLTGRAAQPDAATSEPSPHASPQSSAQSSSQSSSQPERRPEPSHV